MYSILTILNDTATTKDTAMTTTTLNRDIIASIADTRRVIDQARIESAALSGELGVEAQLIAMSQQYLALKAAGKVEEAAAVKAAAYAIYNSQH